MPLGIDAARFLTHSPLRTGLIGAGVGAAAGALRTPREGETRGQSMFRGALRGGALAGGAAALGRGYRDTRLLDPSLVDKGVGASVAATARRIGTGAMNFGKRQVHGLTGAFDHDAIGMAGTVRAGQKAKLLEARMADEIKHAPQRADLIRKGYQSQIAGTLAEGRSSQALADAGITTVPGIAKALASGKTRGAAIRAMGRSITDGPGGAVMSLGIPVAMTAPSILKGDESATGGLTTGQKVRNLGVNIGTGMMFGGLPMIPQLATGAGVDYAMSKLKRSPTPGQPMPGVTP